MTPTLSFVLYNLADGRNDVTDGLKAIRDALDEQLNADFSQAHGGFYVIRVGENPQDRLPGEIAANVRHTVPAPGAIGFHNVTNGVPDIEIALDLTDGDLTRGTGSLAVCLSHEFVETCADPGGNGWKTRGDGSMSDAEEAADFVQNTGYIASNNVWLSNFLRPCAWIPGADGPWDKMGIMKSQYDASNGYGIVAQIGAVNQINARRANWTSFVGMVGELTAAQKRRKQHRFARAWRKGLRLGVAA